MSDLEQGVGSPFVSSEVLVDGVVRTITVDTRIPKSEQLEQGWTANVIKTFHENREKRNKEAIKKSFSTLKSNGEPFERITYWMNIASPNPDGGWMYHKTTIPGCGPYQCIPVDKNGKELEQGVDDKMSDEVKAFNKLVDTLPATGIFTDVGSKKPGYTPEPPKGPSWLENDYRALEDYINRFDSPMVKPAGWDQLENNRKSIEDYLKNCQPSYVHYSDGMTYFPTPSFKPTQEDYDQLRRLDLPAPNLPAGARPSWDDYFLGLAFIASQRSPDRSTKHGCVIVHDRRVIGTGYNGFAPGVDDNGLATTLPKPYHLIVHSERNAINNCVVNPKVLKGVVAYVTGECCGDCAEYLAQNGVTTWVMANRRGFSNPSVECEAKFEKVVRDHGVSIVRMTPNLDWLFADSFMNELRSLGFLS